MMVPDAVAIDGALLKGGVSSAWMVWSSAAEVGLGEALSLAGGPIPDKVLVLGSGSARCRTFR